MTKENAAQPEFETDDPALVEALLTEELYPDNKAEEKKAQENKPDPNAAKPDKVDEKKAAKEKENGEDGADKKKPDQEYSARVQKRIGKLNSQIKQLERRLSSYEKGGLTPPDKDGKSDKEPVNAEPDPKDYDLQEHDPKYIKDLLKYERDEMRAEAKRLYGEERKREAQTDAQSKFAKQVEKFWELGSSKFEDFEDLRDDQDFVISEALAEAFIEEPEQGVEAAHYLAQNPEELEKISDLSPNGQVRWFGRYIAQSELKTKAARLKTKAATVKPIKGSRGANEEDKPLHELLYPDNA
jgi:hypothetical protein